MSIQSIFSVLIALALQSSDRVPERPLSQEPDPRAVNLWQPPLLTPAVPGGPWSPAVPIAPPGSPSAGLPDLAITSVEIVDGSGTPMVPSAGSGFWVRVNFSYTNPVCTPYTIGRTLMGFTNEAPPITWGCGSSGTSYWWHYWGAWVVHHGGVCTVTVALDYGGAITESNESNNLATLNFTVAGSVTPEWALVHAEEGRALLGDGTGVIVGTMDDAFDFTHPWLEGLDSQGLPRLVAANQNALGPGGSPVNAGHATAVMGIVLARGNDPCAITGLAPDARYVTAEFLNRANIPGLPVLHVLDAAGFLVDHDAEVINMSWSWWSNYRESLAGEGSITNLMADYLAYGENIVCVPAVNQLNVPGPTAPGAARNTLTAGGLKDNLIEAWEPQNHGPTSDGRGKPDLLGNDAANAVAPSASWRSGFPASVGFAGTSFAAPFVTGAVAQMLDYGKANGESTHHLVIKAVIMNSGVKALDADGGAWSHTSSQPLDDEQGTGVLDLLRVHAMYSAGERDPRMAAMPGYDLGHVAGNLDEPGGGSVSYQLGTLTSAAERLDVALAFDRHTFWADVNQNGSIDSSDHFHTDPLDTQDDLDLVLYRDGQPVAESRSAVDTIEHLTLAAPPPGSYELRVERHAVPNSGPGETYALAWLADGSWTAPPSPIGLAYCHGDGIAIDCPCGNVGSSGAGCRNSHFASGCTLSASGTPSVSGDSVQLSASRSLPSQPGLYFQGSNAVGGGQGSPFGDGLRCAGGAVVRLQVRVADGEGSAATSVGIAAKGGVSPGDIRRYQWWYRDPTASPCATGFNLSNGLELTWLP